MESTRHAIRRACELTSIRAIPRVFKTDDLSIQALWVLALVSCSLMTVYQLGNVLRTYTAYPVNVNIQQLQSNPHFPDVTVCRINPYGQAWKGQFTFEQYLDRIERLESSNYLRDWFDAFANGSQYDASMLYLKSPVGFYSNLKHSADELNANASSLVQTCFYYLWSANQIQASNISCLGTVAIAFSPLFGKCATFHLEQSDVQNVRGLVAVLYLEDLFEKVLSFYDESSMVTTDGTGLRAIVHAWGTYPDMGLGIDIPPGTETTIDVNEVIRTRLPHPYGICVDCEYQTPDCYPSEGAVLYSVDGCYSICYQRYVIARCGCLDNSAAFTAVELQLSNYSFCGNLNLQNVGPSEFWTAMMSGVGNAEDMARGLAELVCLNDVHASMSDIICPCPVPCEEFQYETRVSYTAWPHRSYQLAFYRNYIRGNPTYGHEFDFYERLLDANDDGRMNDSETLRLLASTDLLTKNFVRLKVRFGRRGLHVLRDSAAMTWDSLMSNVGGTLSLWVDVTAVTIVELIELCYNVVKARRRMATERSAVDASAVANSYI